MTAENFFQRHASLTRESPVHEESRETASVSLVTVSVLCSYYHCHHCHHWFNLSVIAVISNQVEILSWCRFKFKVSSHIYHVFIISYSSVSSPLNSLTFSLSSLTRKTKVINLSVSQSLCSPLCRQQCDLCSMSPWLSSLLVCVRQLYSSPETKPPLSLHKPSNNDLQMPCCPGAVPMDPTAPPFPGYAWKNKVPVALCHRDFVYDHDNHVACHQIVTWGLLGKCWQC